MPRPTVWGLELLPAHLSGHAPAGGFDSHLATRPMALLDEPFSALDYQNRLAVGEEVVKILRERQKTVIMVTHDIPEAVSMANRVVVMTPRPGRIRSIHRIKMCDEGLTPLQTRERPQFREYFTIWKELNRDD